MIYSGMEMTDFRGAVRLKDGLMVLDDATFNLFGGTITAKGTEAEIWRGVMPFKASLQVQGVDLGAALAAKTKYGGLVDGKTDMGIQLTGRGFETAELEKALTGTIGMAMKEGQFKTVSLLDSVTGGFSSSLAKIPGVSAQKVPGNNSFKDLAANFQVEDGKLKLKAPVTTAIDGNKVQLDGALGIAGGLFLEGTYFLSAKTATAMTGGKCQAESDLPIPLKIEGTARAPAIRPDVGGVAGALAERCLKSVAGSAAAKALGDKLGVKVPTNVDDAKQKLEAEAAAKRAEAEGKARAEADRIRQETEARIAAEKAKAQRAAEDAAKKKAQDKLKGFFK